MKILHITGAKVWGGNEQQLIDSCVEMEKMGVSSYIFCYKNSTISDIATENGIPTLYSVSLKTFSFKKGRQLKKIIKEYCFDVIHLHTSDSVTTFVLSDLLFKLKVPAVFSKKGINSSIKRGLSAYKYNYKNIKKVICVSKAVLESFKRTLKPKNHHKLTVVYDGVNIERIVPSKVKIRKKYKINANDILIGNIANHVKAKDLVTLVKTLNYLVNTLKVKNVKIIQIGSKSKYSNEFISLISKYNLEKYFIVAGFIENASGYIHQFDAYIMTSEREGGPTSLLEAICLKKPIIVTKTGIATALDSKNITIELAEIKDFKKLAQGIVSVIKKNNQEKSNDAYDKLIDKFSMQRLAKETISIYNFIN